MKKFEFKLDRLERVREIARDRAALELARSEAVRAACESALSQCEAVQSASWNSRRIPAGDLPPGDVLLAIDQFGQTCKMRVNRAAQSLVSARDTENAARSRLLEKAREKKAVEKFRERKLSQYLEESLRYEQKEIDDGASMRWRLNYR